MPRGIPYPYLASSLVLLQVLVIGIAFGAGQRRSTVVSGLLSAPFALASVFFVPDYWSPVRLVDFPAGPEDFIFSFATGGTAWLLAIWPLRARFTTAPAPSRLLSRYLICTTLGVVSAGFLWASGLSAMVSAILMISALWVALLWHRRELWPLSAAGALGFTAYYTGIVVVLSTALPVLQLHWNPHNLWGPRLFGVPVEEVAWALAYGAVWPLFMAYVFDARPVPRLDAKARLLP